MKVVMTLLARNEADIVDAQIAFHLHAGVDFVIATDNGSDDGTTEILQRYERAGYLHLIQEPAEDMRQSEWVTRMARFAATHYGADWVINSDADEFWWPRGGTLKDVLALVPERYGVVRGCWRHFVARPKGPGDFAERMTIRLCTPAHPGDKRTIYHAHQKVAHRGRPDVVIEAGNHNAVAHALDPIRAWNPIEVLHFSLRSVEQLQWKAHGGWRRGHDDRVEHQRRLDSAFERGSLEELYEESAVSDGDLARGLETGTLAVDTRLRDALRQLRQGGDGFVLPGRVALAFSAPRVEETAAFAAEASVLAEIDAIPRAEARVAALEERIAALRTLPRR